MFRVTFVMMLLALFFSRVNVGAWNYETDTDNEGYGYKSSPYDSRTYSNDDSTYGNSFNSSLGPNQYKSLEDDRYSSGSALERQSHYEQDRLSGGWNDGKSVLERDRDFERNNMGY